MDCQKKRVTLLGSTGSIGKSTLDVLLAHRDQFEVIALTAQKNAKLLFEQCLAFQPIYAVMTDADQALVLQHLIKNSGLKTKVLSGASHLEVVAALPEVDCVMAAIVGAAGLLPTLAAAKAGKSLLLANKESLVMSGQLFMDTIKASGATLLPVDSEHNALFQCMPAGYLTGQTPLCIEKIVLTASGGPFRSLAHENFEDITPDEAVRHPVWSMGAKISVDSATMMNKGFEVIEAYWLFNMSLEQIEVIVHPQSTIHSLVYYQDGSVLAQLGTPDMRIPIAHTLSWPDRMSAPVEKLDLLRLGRLTFESVDHSRFPCLNLAYDAIRVGGTASASLNAANEVAVAAFLEKKLRFNQIPILISKVLDQVPNSPADSLEAILQADQLARETATKLLPLMTTRKFSTVAV